MENRAIKEKGWFKLDEVRFGYEIEIGADMVRGKYSRLGYADSGIVELILTAERRDKNVFWYSYGETVEDFTKEKPEYSWALMRVMNRAAQIKNFLMEGLE